MRQSIIIAALLAGAACSDDAGPADGGPSPDTARSEGGAGVDGSRSDGRPADAAGAKVKVQVAFKALTFDRPLALVTPGDGSGRLFVAEQGGKIHVFKNESGVSSTKVFLDLSKKVDATDFEKGLLGLAFHPSYSKNGLFFVNYTAAGPDRSINSRFKVSAGDPDLANASSEVPILSYGQPHGNHNGGHVMFGPDGYLYIGVGDGGAGGDPQGHGQDLKTLLGSILRIDVDSPAAGKAYGVPKDNPHVGNASGFKEEIYAHGFRNPWRFSWDDKTGQLWVGDVGQDLWEEVNLVTSGKNYGWNTMEGKHCFSPRSGCSSAGLESPVWEYTTSGKGQSVTGGFVYRGKKVPALVGSYVYADFITGQVWKLTLDGNTGAATNTLVASVSVGVSSFGVDGQGELYFAAFDGKIYTFVQQ